MGPRRTKTAPRELAWGWEPTGRERAVGNGWDPVNPGRLGDGLATKLGGRVPGSAAVITQQLQAARVDRAAASPIGVVHLISLNEGAAEAASMR